MGTRFSTADSLRGCRIQKLMLNKQIDDDSFGNVNKYIQLIPPSILQLQSVEILIKVL